MSSCTSKTSPASSLFFQRSGREWNAAILQLIQERKVSAFFSSSIDYIYVYRVLLSIRRRVGAPNVLF